jgi:aldose 1-epimerase
MHNATHEWHRSNWPACGLRCTLATGLGGSIAGLWLDAVPVLRSTSGGGWLTDVRLAGSYPLVPFSNRIGHATLQWQGTSHPLVRNNGDEPHAIHGVGWQAALAAAGVRRRFALLSFEHRPDASAGRSPLTLADLPYRRRITGD